MSSTDSPLAEAQPESMAAIMSKDPLDLTRQDRDKIISILRAQRESFAKEDAAPKVKKPKLEKVAKPSLEDLGL